MMIKSNDKSVFGGEMIDYSVGLGCQDVGLYNASNEHDACGVGMLAHLHGEKSHSLVEQALTVLAHMRHRGAEGADNRTGDGAGILVQIPHEFILLQGIAVPEKGYYGTGLVFLPKDVGAQQVLLAAMREETERLGGEWLAVRDVPVRSEVLGAVAQATEPAIKQIFVTGFGEGDEAERRLYRLRKHIERRVECMEVTGLSDFYVVSLSTRTLIYKGMLSSVQLGDYFPDLRQPYFTSGLALVHSRFSTNTFPAWALAQPFRLLAHNGEINTIRGNRGWLTARESVLSSPALGDARDFAPIVQPGMSDSASLDNALEFLVRSGLSLPHAMAMLVPESFDAKNPISDALKAFYEYHSILVEPWDGPAALLFSDGRYAGGMLDRNGLRPARYFVTDDGLVVLASEAGVIDVDPVHVCEKGRLQPGKLFMVDTQEGRIYRDDELKRQLAEAYPYRAWLEGNRLELDKLHSGRQVTQQVDDADRKLRAFGYAREDVGRVLRPMAQQAAEPVTAMGNDTPLAVLSARPQLFFNYFRQQFAQVTNPPIDPIRERLVMSLTEYIGRVDGQLLVPDESHAKMVRLPHPVLNNRQLDVLCHIRYKGFTAVRLSMLFERERGGEGLREALDRLCRQAEAAVDDGGSYIVLSDRDVDSTHVAIPSLLAVSAVHQHLIRVGKRSRTALIAECGDAREVMHAALLLGFGASAINPYMAFALLDRMVSRQELQLDYATAERNYVRALCKGLLKIMSKMGISTLRSYRGARIFEAIGLGEEISRCYMGGLPSPVGGVGFDEIARDAVALHASGYDTEEFGSSLLPANGLYAYRKDGEVHAWDPDAIRLLQLSTRTGSYKVFKEFTLHVDGREQPIFLRDFFDFRRRPIPLERVESVDSLVRRFVTGAMSFGAISQEAHEAIALAMNALHGRSNTGEGGEDAARFGTSRRSAVKQVASGRFGVTTAYLVDADEIQIKIAQGAKPGEGGQLPGFKVDEVIARMRHSTPGISLISPPPHHDIYSIEDLAQLIFDLRNVNPRAKVSVKLVAEHGVGTVVAGVAKAGADIVVISGAEGGTGASPASSVRYAGSAPELGLSEAQQTLVLNGLRGRVKLQVDGQLKTGRDVVLMALLGAEEFGFATAALVVMGCVMMRKCSQNTCPVGVATQDPALRRHFLGRSEYLVNYFRFLAQEVRELLAELGAERLDDIVGHTELILRRPATGQPKYALLSFDRLLARVGKDGDLRFAASRPLDFSGVRDAEVLRALDAAPGQQSLSMVLPVRNTDRSVGAFLSGELTRRLAGGAGVPRRVDVTFTGSAGQSFGAFLTEGVSLRLEGEANDYLGKGLSGGRIVVVPPAGSTFVPGDNVIAGNTLLYGATAGEVYLCGQAGERFAVRNSGAVAVVEGVGDHCCEYMTGGRVVVLGPTGRNFAAGMSGGIAYVWDSAGRFDECCNMEMVELSLLEDITARRELYALVRQHYRYTGSSRAEQLLEDWERHVGEFIQVVPVEYMRVMHAQQMQRLERRMADTVRDDA